MPLKSVPSLAEGGEVAIPSTEWDYSSVAEMSTMTKTFSFERRTHLVSQ